MYFQMCVNMTTGSVKNEESFGIQSYGTSSSYNYQTNRLIDKFEDGLKKYL